MAAGTAGFLETEFQPLPLSSQDLYLPSLGILLISPMKALANWIHGLPCIQDDLADYLSKIPASMGSWVLGRQENLGDTLHPLVIGLPCFPVTLVGRAYV